jgi:FkbM family methyltransferase
MPVIVSWVEGTSLAMEQGMNSPTMNFYCGLFEPVDMGFVLHLLRPGDTFVDVGANVGTFTILASGVSKANTIALEPLPATFDRMMRNLLLNDLLNSVDARRLAVGSHSGLVRITSGCDATNRAVSLLPTPGSESTVVVPLISPDELLKECSPPLVWKVDEEGYELRFCAVPSQLCSSPIYAPFFWKPTPQPSSARWSRLASPAIATIFSAVRSAPCCAPLPPGATTNSGFAISPSCKRDAAQRRR